VVRSSTQAARSAIIESRSPSGSRRDSSTSRRSLTALREVSDALTALGKFSEAETGQDAAVKALEEAVGHAMDRYQHGLASYYEVLEAQQQLYPAQNTLAQIRLNRLLSYVRLYRALGGGWNLADAQWITEERAESR
jgi:outer membrane protein, multidrug efflux system